MELDGAERDELQRALTSAFASVEHLRRVVAATCRRDLEALGVSGGLRERVFALIHMAEAEGWLRELIRGAYQALPRHPRLQRFVQVYLASVQRSIPRVGLERIFGSGRADAEREHWRKRLSSIERQVCRVEPEVGAALGTGFLVSPSVVLTNFHVIENRLLESLRVRFGRKVLQDGTLLHPGTVYRVTRCLARSPYSPADLMHPRPRDATSGELDYAFLEVAGVPGEDLVDGEPRGWLAPPDSRESFTPGSLVLIVQHPAGQPMSVALDEFLGVNPGRTRVAYRACTGPGSSGAPCFTQDLRLAALHHSGGPRVPSASVGHNEGIPIDTIRGSLSGSMLSQLGWG
ncbi:effector-associated domain EAD1-containing protein [Myxococcus virescens]|uniref:effector-associated domain EAD1-containing protein n=1 Tax=Myxococcus virescens TaxID=83456 RepID=UPI003DA42608